MTKGYHQAKTLEEYLSRRYVVDPITGCWNWIRSTDRYGYGQCNERWFKLFGKRRAHSLAYICWKGDVNNKCILHHCDNRKCINPEHLWSGTQEENRLDMLNKNRQTAPKGEKHKHSKLKYKDVDYIRKNKGIKTCFELATKFKVSFSLICMVWRNEVWREV